MYSAFLPREICISEEWKILELLVETGKEAPWSFKSILPGSSVIWYCDFLNGEYLSILIIKMQLVIWYHYTMSYIDHLIKMQLVSGITIL